MFKTTLIAAACAAGLLAASGAPADARPWHGGGHGHWGGGHGWRGGWHGGYRPYRPVHFGYRPWAYRPVFRPAYRPVVVAGPAYWGGCRVERRVRYSYRLGAYVVRHVRVCY